MRIASAVVALLPQRETLMHSEAVLLVDHDQAQFGECDAVLKQGVRTHRLLRLAAREPRHCRRALLRLELALEAVDALAELGKPNTEKAEVLFGEQLGRRHHRRLKARLHRSERRRRGDQW